MSGKSSKTFCSCENILLYNSYQCQNFDFLHDLLSKAYFHCNFACTVLTKLFNSTDWLICLI